MKQAIDFIFIGILFVVFSCKKETVTPNSTGSNSSGPVITSSTATSWYGMFNVGKFHDINGSSMNVYTTAQVNFFKQPEQFPNNDAAVVDSVFLNGIPMQFWAFQDSSYIDTVGLMAGMPHTIAYPYTYKVVANGIIPSFSYTENGPYPDYTGYITLPDTIYKNSGVVLSLSGISGSDYIIIDISNGMKDISHTLLPPYNLVNSFSASELLQLDTISHANIQIALIKNDNKKVNNRPMLFTTGCNYNKRVVVK